MAVDKVLEIDLTNLNAQSLKAIDEQIDILKQSLVNRDDRSVSEKFGDPLTIPNSVKESTLQKIFGRETFGNLKSIGTNPAGFLTSGVTKLIPFIGTALLITGVIADFVKKVDDFQNEFVDNVDNRINLFRDKEQQAQVQAGLQQIIITSAAGSAEPRDAYNTFNEFNTNQARIESDFRLRDTSGVD